MESNGNLVDNIENVYVNNSSDKEFNKLLSDESIIWDIPFVWYTFILLYSIVFLANIFGNLAVIITVTIHWRLRSITNFFLANLAFADICIGIFCIYQNLNSVLGKNWLLGDFLCKMYHYIPQMAHTASTLILVVLCIEKYIAIIHPVNYKHWITINRVRLTTLTIWTLSSTYALPKLYYAEARTHNHLIDDGVKETICAPNLEKYNFKLFDIIHMGLLFCFPLLIIMVLYCIIGFNLWKMNKCYYDPVSISEHGTTYEIDDNGLVRRNSDICKGEFSCLNVLCFYNTIKKCPCCSKESIPDIPLSNVHTNSPIPSIEINGEPCNPRENNELNNKRVKTKQSSKETKESNTKSYRRRNHPEQEKDKTTSSSRTGKTKRKFIKMLIIIVISFTICNLPYRVRKMWQIFGNNYNGASTLSKLLTASTFLLMFVASSLNPYLYAFFSKRFRQCFVDIISCRSKRRRKEKNTGTFMPKDSQQNQFS